jgi:hypothetical protein
VIEKSIILRFTRCRFSSAGKARANAPSDAPQARQAIPMIRHRAADRQRRAGAPPLPSGQFRGQAEAGLGWFVWELRGHAPMPWLYGYYPDASSAVLLKVPDRQLTLILLASSDRASSPFGLGSGDPVCYSFVTAFLDAVGRGD